MAKRFSSQERTLNYMLYLNREHERRHHYYDEEMKQYRMMQSGDPDAVEEAVRMITSGLPGHLSDDPVRNMKYLVIACITITTRFAIEGGLNTETAYTSSDMFINRMDTLKTVDEVLKLHREMFSFFTRKMSEVRRASVYSRPVTRVMEYIDMHLNVPMRVPELASFVSLDPSYLSTLFKKEMGICLSDYILQRRIETAKNILLFSDYTESQISEGLAFSSQSYFIRCFRKLEHMTPFQFRKQFLKASLQAAGQENA